MVIGSPSQLLRIMEVRDQEINWQMIIPFSSSNFVTATKFDKNTSFFSFVVSVIFNLLINSSQKNVECNTRPL